MDIEDTIMARLPDVLAEMIRPTASRFMVFVFRRQQADQRDG
jgi:hypothetical protein